jgi:hypothetical protein
MFESTTFSPSSFESLAPISIGIAIGLQSLIPNFWRIFRVYAQDSRLMRSTAEIEVERNSKLQTQGGVGGEMELGISGLAVDWGTREK